MKLLKKWLGILELESQMKDLEVEVKSLKSKNIDLSSEVKYFSNLAKDIQKEFKLHTSMDIDVNPRGRGRNKIVLTGCFKNRDYCNIIELDQGEFEYLAREYSERSRLYSTGRRDVPFDFDVGYIDHRAKSYEF